MAKKKVTKIFFYGKNIKKSDSVHSPIYGEKNTNIDFYDKSTGKFHRRRKIGKEGVAIKDYDAPDIHKSNYHVHDFEGTSRSSKDRLPNRRERHEINKVSKKRRFWK